MILFKDLDINNVDVETIKDIARDGLEIRNLKLRFERTAKEIYGQNCYYNYKAGAGNQHKDYYKVRAKGKKLLDMIKDKYKDSAYMKLENYATDYYAYKETGISMSDISTNKLERYVDLMNKVHKAMQILMI